jgi:NADH-quinone oxidoreductase subunit C
MTEEDQTPVVAPLEIHGQPAKVTPTGTVIFCAREQLFDLVVALRSEGFLQLVDLCGVDYLHHPDRSGLPDGVIAERFEVVVGLINHSERTRVRIRVQVPEGQPSVPTLFHIHPGADAMERETYDLLGIEFEGHPDHTRILLPESWVGHPLRKDYDVGRIPVQFKAAPAAR